MKVYQAKFNEFMNDNLKWLIVQAALADDQDLFDDLTTSSHSQLPEKVCDTEFVCDFPKQASGIVLIVDTDNRTT